MATRSLVVEGSQAVRPLSQEEIALLELWYTKTVVRNVAHDLASMHFMKVQKVLRTIMVLLPAIASFLGTSATVGIYHGKYLAMFAMLTTATVIAVESRLHCAEKSETHHHATLKFRSLEKKIKSLFEYDRVKSPGATITIIRKKYDEIMSSSPIVPAILFRKAEAQMTHHKLSVLGACLLQDDRADAKAYFSKRELEMLQARTAMARSNRKYCMDTADKYQSRALYLGTAMGTVAVVATMLGALAFADISQADLFQFAAGVGSGCLSALAIVTGTGGYDEMTKRMYDLGNRWSRLGKELEQVLLTQPHYNASAVAVALEKKVSRIVDELKEMRLMEHFRHKEHPDVQTELNKLLEFSTKAQAWASPSAVSFKVDVGVNAG